MAKFKSRENKLPPKKFRENLLLLFTLLNFNEIGGKQCKKKTTICLPFLLLSRTIHEISVNEFPRVKFEIQIRENMFPRNSKTSKSANSNSREKFMPHGKSVRRFLAIAGSRLTSSKTSPILFRDYVEHSSIYRFSYVAQPVSFLPSLMDHDR